MDEMGERVVTETAEEEEGGGARKGLGEVVVQLGSVEGERDNLLRHQNSQEYHWSSKKLYGCFVALEANLVSSGRLFWNHF